MYHRSLGLVVDASEAERAGVVVEGVEPPLELPLHGLGVGLVGGEHVLVGDPSGGAAAHLLEAALREPQAGALERDVRVGHHADGSGHEPLPTPIFSAGWHRGAQAQSGGPDGWGGSLGDGRAQLPAVCEGHVLAQRVHTSYVECCDDPADDRFEAGPAGMSRPTSISDHAKVAGMAVLPLAAMVVGVKVAWPDVTWGTMLGGTIDGLLTALVALGIAIVYRANRIVNFSAADLGQTPGDPRAAALRLVGLEHLPRDGHGTARVDRARRSRRVPVPAAVLPCAPAHPDRRHHRRHRGRGRARVAVAAVAGQQQRRAVPAVHQPALRDRPGPEQHELLRQRRAHPDRGARRADRARRVLPLHVDRRRPARHGRERGPGLAARHPGATAPERGVGSRRVPRVRRDVPAHRCRRLRSSARCSTRHSCSWRWAPR